eukprot:550618_1
MIKTIIYRLHLIISIIFHLIINGLSRLFCCKRRNSNSMSDGLVLDDAHSSELRKLPFYILYDIIMKEKELNSWNKLAAMIDYTYPSKEKLNIYGNKESNHKLSDKESQIMNEMKYCIKYASYAYFMPIIGNPLDIIIKKEDKSLPFLGPKSFGICNAGYFIGIDPKNKYILLCIRGTETIGDTLTDLDAHVSSENFGDDKTFNVHCGIYRAAKVMEKNVTEKIKKYVSEYPNYKILVTGHSLGAGLCSLLGLLWKTKKTFKNERFSCYSFASPLVIDYKGMKSSLDGNNMISIAVTTDIVTRLSTEGLITLNERMKIIRKYENYEDIVNNIVKTRCSSETYKEFQNNLGENEKLLIKELKMQNNEDIRNDLLLYPCGELLWFVPEFLLDNNFSNKHKYNNLINLINWQCETNEFTQTLQFIYKIISDFYVFDKNEILTSVHAVNRIGNINKLNVSKPIHKKPHISNRKSISESIDRFEVDRFEFTQLVSCGIESFQAHLPGRYSSGFDVDVFDIFEMSKYYKKLKSLPIPESILNIVVLIIIILVCMLKISLQIFTDIMSYLYRTFKLTFINHHH